MDEVGDGIGNCYVFGSIVAAATVVVVAKGATVIGPVVLVVIAAVYSISVVEVDGEWYGFGDDYHDHPIYLFITFYKLYLLYLLYLLYIHISILFVCIRF